MRVGLRRFLFGSLRRQLILGVALVHALMMALFVWDLVERQKDMLLDRQVQQASALAYSVATSSAGWLASRDYFGLQEIITAQTRYPDLAFAMLLDTGGQVLAHTDIRRLRQQVTDLPEQVETALLAHSSTLVDVVTPVMLSGIHIGWVRIGLGQATTELRLKDLVRDGVLYALAAILIGSLIAGVMGSRLARRVTALRADMEAFQAGETARRARVEGADEASELARGFNFMLDVLGQREQQLHESMAALAISEERWLLALDGAGHGVWDWDVVRDRLFLSPRWRSMLGYSGDEVGERMQDWAQLVHADDLAEFRASLAEREESRRVCHLEHRLRCRDGSWKWMLARGAVFSRDETGSSLRLVGTLTDISEQKLLQQTLQESERRATRLFESAADAMLLVDEAGVIRRINEAGERLFGYRRDELVGSAVDRLLATEVHAGGGRLIDALLASPGAGVEAFARPWIGHTRSGERLDLQLSLALLQTSGQRQVLASLQDVTERNRAVAALRVSEERFQLAMAATSDGVWDWDLQTDRIYYSPHWKGMLGYRADDLGNDLATWQDLVDEAGERRTMALIKECLDGERDHFETEFRMRHKQGHWIDILSRGRLHRADAGQPLRLIGTHQDISERKRAEQMLIDHQSELERLVNERTAALQEAEERMRLILDATADGIFGLDRQGRFNFLNQAAQTMLGYQPAELQGRSVHETIHQRDAEGRPALVDECPIQRSMREARLMRVPQDAFWRQDGAMIEVEYAATPMFKDQRVVGAVVAFHDVSQRNRMERELRESQAYLSYAQSLARLGSWRMQLAERRLYCSDEACRIFGLERSAPPGMDWSDLLAAIDDRDREVFLAAWDAAQHSGVLDLEHRLVNDDQTRWVRHRAEIRCDVPGRPGAVLGTVQDITELKQAVERAEYLAAAKSEFLAKMSHEIRTPMNAVLGFAEMGLRQSGDQQSRIAFERILGSGRHLLGVINDILDFSKIEAGKLSIAARPFDLPTLLRESMALVTQMARERGLELRLELDPGLPRWIVGDSLRLGQVLLNLLSNSVKFTHQGEVSVRAWSDAGDLFLQIADSGIGMNEKQLEKLFAPFEQADDSISRGYGGTGLGMAISRSLLSMMDGAIEVESEPGRGTRFLLRLPLIECDQSQQPADGTTADPPVQRRLAGLRILAMEDQELNRIVLEDLLLFEGAEVVFAENGRVGLDRLRAEGIDSFDLVLTDLHMPVMDGLEATRQLRAMAPALPVIGVTADAMEEERRRCKEIGMCDYVTKPIDSEQLVAAILRQFPGGAGGA